MLRRAFAIVCVLLIGAIARAEVTLRADMMPEQGDQRMDAAARRATVRAFLDANPDVRIDTFSMPTVNGSSAQESGPLMAISAGVAPDVMFVNLRKVSTYSVQGFLDPMEILLARVRSTNPHERQSDRDGRWLADPTPAEVEAALKELHAHCTEALWPVIYREDESGTIKGAHVWALPIHTLVQSLIYRKDLFQQAGLDPDHAPRDWNEFLDDARKLTDPDHGRYGVAFHSLNMAWSTFSLFASSGARAVEKDARGRWRAVYDTPQAADALNMIWRLVREPFERDGKTIRGTAMLYPGKIEIPWDRGQIGMMFVYLNDEALSNMVLERDAIAPVPLGPGGQRASELNAEMLGVFARSSPEKRLAAMRYIAFFVSEQAKRIRTKLYVDSGFGLFVAPDLLKKFGYNTLLEQQPRGWKELIDTAMSAGVPEPYGRNTDAIWRYMSQPIDAAILLPASMSEATRYATIAKLLKDSTAEVNRKLLGNIPTETLTYRRHVAFAVMLAVALIFGVGMGHVWRYFGRMARATHGGDKRGRSLAYAMLLPALGLIVLWQYLPLAGGALISVADYQLIRPSTFAGVDNFADVLFDEKFWAAFGHTIYYVALILGLGFWPPILLAILLQEVPTQSAKYFFRVVYYLPALVSGVIVMFLWRELYEPSAHGVLNQLIMSVNYLGPVSATIVKWTAGAVWLLLILFLLQLPSMLSRLLSIALIAVSAWLLASTLRPADFVGAFHVEPLQWIASPGLAMVCVVIPIVWAASGHASILYLAALKNIPEELYEAAELDGARWSDKIFFIVLPRLKYLLVIQFIAAVIGAFKGGTDYILALTGGGPNGATDVLALEIFQRTFLDLQFGIGAAMAWLLGAVLVGFTAYQLKMLSRAEFRAGGA